MGRQSERTSSAHYLRSSFQMGDSTYSAASVSGALPDLPPERRCEHVNPIYHQHDLDDFEQASWMVSAYLLASTGFLTPLAKQSDLYGYEPILFTSIVLFAAFSAGAGRCQDMVQLCIFAPFGLQVVGE